MRLVDYSSSSDEDDRSWDSFGAIPSDTDDSAVMSVRSPADSPMVSPSSSPMMSPDSAPTSPVSAHSSSFSFGVASSDTSPVVKETIVVEKQVAKDPTNGARTVKVSTSYHVETTRTSPGKTTGASSTDDTSGGSSEEPSARRASVFGDRPRKWDFRFGSSMRADSGATSSAGASFTRGEFSRSENENPATLRTAFEASHFKRKSPGTPGTSKTIGNTHLAGDDAAPMEVSDDSEMPDEPSATDECSPTRLPAQNPPGGQEQQHANPFDRGQHQTFGPQSFQSGQSGANHSNYARQSSLQGNHGRHRHAPFQRHRSSSSLFSRSRGSSLEDKTDPGASSAAQGAPESHGGTAEQLPPQDRSGVFSFGSTSSNFAAPAFVFGDKPKPPSFSFGSTATKTQTATKETVPLGSSDGTSPWSSTTYAAGWNPDSAFRVPETTDTSVRTNAFFKPPATPAPAPAPAPPTKWKDFTFTAKASRRETSNHEATIPPPPRISLARAFEEMNSGSAGFSGPTPSGNSFSTGIGDPAGQRPSARSRRRRTHGASSARATAPSAVPPPPAPTFNMPGPTPAAAPSPVPPLFGVAKESSADGSPSLFDFVKKRSTEEAFPASVPENRQQNGGDSNGAGSKGGSLFGNNKFSANGERAKTTAAFNSFAAGYQRQPNDSRSSASDASAGVGGTFTPHLSSFKTSVFGWSGFSTGASASSTSTQPQMPAQSPFGIKAKAPQFHFGRQDSNASQPGVDKLKTTFGGFCIGSAGTPRKTTRARRKTGLFSGRNPHDQPEQESDAWQTGSPFGLRASTSTESPRERRNFGQSAPADPFVTPLYTTRKSTSPSADPPAQPSRFVRRSSSRKGIQPKIPARFDSAKPAQYPQPTDRQQSRSVATMVDQRDAEMDSSDDDTNWGELKRLGGDAHTSKNYTEAANYYRQSIEALDSLIERRPDLRTDAHMKDKAKLHANRAASLMMTMQMSEAQRECKVSIEIDPSYTRAYLRLGRIQVMLGDIVEAKRNMLIAKRLVTGPRGRLDASSDDKASINKLEVTINKLSALQGEIKWCTDVGDIRLALTHTETALGLAPSCRTLQVQKARLLLDQKYVITVWVV